jgi:hypothetical protein
MADVALDLNKASSNYNDFLLIDNDLALTSDAQANSPINPVQQDILQRLRFFYGEWFLDNTQGVPWFQQILVKNPDTSKVDLILLNTILTTPGVTAVTSYSFTPNYAARVLNVTFSATTTSGPINYNGTVGA